MSLARRHRNNGTDACTEKAHCADTKELANWRAVRGNDPHPCTTSTLTGDQAHVSVTRSTAGEVLDALIAAHPDLGPALLADGDDLATSTYESINLMVGREDINELQDRATPVSESDQSGA